MPNTDFNKLRKIAETETKKVWKKLPKSFTIMGEVYTLNTKKTLPKDNKKLHCFIVEYREPGGKYFTAFDPGRFVPTPGGKLKYEIEEYANTLDVDSDPNMDIDQDIFSEFTIDFPSFVLDSPEDYNKLSKYFNYEEIPADFKRFGSFLLDYESEYGYDDDYEESMKTRSEKLLNFLESKYPTPSPDTIKEFDLTINGSFDSYVKEYGIDMSDIMKGMDKMRSGKTLSVSYPIPVLLKKEEDGYYGAIDGESTLIDTDDMLYGLLLSIAAENGKIANYIK